ncbi:MAG: hypothetical protein KGM92_08570 [Acidobacteriota bacterium]|nr:hypothetical protein [Acidobacteriota bacterium]
MSTNRAFDHLVAPFLFFLFSVRFAAEIEIIRKILHVLYTGNQLQLVAILLVEGAQLGVADLIRSQGLSARPRR